jgi:hypothetical protein
MGPPTPAAQKTTTRPVISAPELVKETIEKRAPIPSGNGPVILEQRTLPEYCRLNINCAVPLAENVIRIFTRHNLCSNFLFLKTNRDHNKTYLLRLKILMFVFC